jgi:HIRAN domain-containing protein
MSVTELPEADGGKATETARRLLLVWQDPATRAFNPVGALVRDPDGSFVFRYIRRALRLPAFLPLASFPQLDGIYRFADLPPFFENRVMSPRRPDYPDYLRALDLSLEQATPFEVLARTGGSRVTDTFHVVAEPAADRDGRVRTLFLAHGVRHVDGADEVIARLRPGDPLTLRPEPDNNHNSRALLIDAEAGGAVGYVPDWMLDIVRRMTDIDPDYRLSVEVANGPETPAHLRLLCRLEATLPDGWAPPPDPDFDYLEVGETSAPERRA